MLFTCNQTWTNAAKVFIAATKAQKSVETPRVLTNATRNVKKGSLIIPIRVSASVNILNLAIV